MRRSTKLLKRNDWGTKTPESFPVRDFTVQADLMVSYPPEKCAVQRLRVSSIAF